MTKFGKKIILIVLTCMALVTLLSVSVVEDSVKKQLMTSALKQLQLSAMGQADQFDTDLKTVEATTHELRRLVESHFDTKSFNENADYMNQLVKVLTPAVEKITADSAINHSAYVYFLPEMTGEAQSIWFSDLDKDGALELQPKLPVAYFDGDQNVKAWYYGPIQTLKGYWTEPYLGSAPVDRDIVYFSYTEPIIAGGKVIGVVGNDYYFNNMRDSILSYKLEGKGYAVLLDQEGGVLVHPELKTGVDLKVYQNGKFKVMIDQIKKNEFGTFRYKWENDEPKIMVFKRLSNGWTFLATMTEKEIYANLYAYNQVKWFILALGLFVTFLILYRIARKAISPMKDIKEFLERLNQGDFSEVVSYDQLKRSDEFGNVFRKLEQLRVDLKHQSEHFMIDQTQLETLLSEKHEALLKSNEYLELSLAQLQERNNDLSLVHERYEDQLKRNNLLSERLYSSEQLASMAYILTGLAYDLNSPIGNTKTMTSFLLSETAQMERKFSEGNLKKQDFEEFIKSLKDSLVLIEKGMDASSQQLQLFKRISSGQMPHQATVFNMKSELSKLFHHIAEQVSNQQLRLSLTMPDLVIKADIGAFVQLFSNLMRFSINYSYLLSSKGMIHIRVEKLSPTSVQIIYEDFDRTVEASALEKALVPHLTATLGNENHLVLLNICYHIVTKLFGGTFTHETVSDSGHKFFMLLKVEVME